MNDRDADATTTVLPCANRVNPGTPDSETQPTKVAAEVPADSPDYEAPEVPAPEVPASEVPASEAPAPLGVVGPGAYRLRAGFASAVAKLRARVAPWLAPRIGGIVAALVAFAILGLTSRGFENTPFNNYSLLANALVHGRLWIDWPGPYIDAVLWNGHRYIVNDPLPGVVLAPFAFAYGEQTNQTLMGAFFAAAGCYFAYRLPRRLGASPAISTWLVSFYFAGTDLWWSASLGDVWFVAQVCAMTLLTASVYEALTRRRPIVVAVLFGLAVFSRFTMVLSAPALALLMYLGPDAVPMRYARRSALRFALALAPFALLWFAYNQLRWGVPYDRGHTIFFHEDVAAGSATGSPFGFSHVLYQLHSFFMQAPDYRDSFPWLIPSNSGVALTFTSPALVLALRARRKITVVTTLWIATFLAAGPSLMYYVNGYAQYGMRHAMDFEPYLYVLMILGVRTRLSFLGACTIVWSVLAGWYGTWYWHAFDRQ